MSNTDSLLQLVKALNASLALGVSGLRSARFIGEKLQEMQEDGREPSSEEWEEIRAMAEDADSRLTDAIDKSQ